MRKISNFALVALNVGVDLNDPSFWQKGMDYLSMQIEKLERVSILIKIFRSFQRTTPFF